MCVAVCEPNVPVIYSEMLVLLFKKVLLAFRINNHKKGMLW